MVGMRGWCALTATSLLLATGGCPQGELSSLLDSLTTGNLGAGETNETGDDFDGADEDNDFEEEVDDDRDELDDDGDEPDSDESEVTIFPDSLSLDISELPDDDAEASAKLLTSSPSDYTGIRRTILAGAAILNGFHNLADRTLALAAVIHRDLRDPNQTQVSGTFFVGALPVMYKADFAAFDIDGDGTPDGSGNAFETPIAIRMWVDRGAGYQPLLCALITDRPSRENLGAGVMFGHPSAANPLAFEDLQFKVEWDRTDEAHKWNQAWLSGAVRNGYAMSIGTQRVDVRTYDDETVEKTVRSNSQLTQSLAGFSSYRFEGHFRRLEPVVLVSAQSSGGVVQVDFSDACVDLELGGLAEEGACDEFDLTDFTPLDTPVAGSAEFPASFPAEPTF